MRQYYQAQAAPQIDTQYRGPNAADIARAWKGAQDTQQQKRPDPKPEEQPQEQPQQEGGQSSATYGMFGGAAPMMLSGGDGQGALGLGGGTLANSLGGGEMGDAGMSALGGAMGPTVADLAQKYPSLFGLGGMFK